MIRIGSAFHVRGTPFNERLRAALGRPCLNVPKGTWLSGSADSGLLAQVAAITDVQGELDRILSAPSSDRYWPRITSDVGVELFA